jgi:hypothetical protein
MQELSDHIEAALKKDPPEKVAQDLKLAPPIRVENIAAGDPIPGIGVNKDFEQSISGLKKGEVSQLVAVPPNRAVVAVVTGVTPTHPATFDEVEARIKQAVEQQKLEQLLNQRAADLMAKTNAMNGDLGKAAKAIGLEAKTSAAVDRSGAVEGLGPASYVMQAFTKPDGSVFGPLTLPDGRVIVKVRSHMPADKSQFAAQRSAIRDELKGRKARERNDLFEAGLRQQLIKEGVVKIHQNVVDQLVANARG